MNKLVLATASWCGPCSALKSRIQKENLVVEIKDVDEDPDFFRKFKIKTVPKLIVIAEEGFNAISGGDEIINAIKKNAQ